MAEKIGSMLLTLAVRLVILRLLTRDILGFMSIPSAVVTVLLVIVDGGFSQSLIRHRNPREYDYKSVFLFNIAMAALLYVAVLALSPLAAPLVRHARNRSHRTRLLPPPAPQCPLLGPELHLRPAVPLRTPLQGDLPFGTRRRVWRPSSWH